jgi:ubiquinone/menaquinone biosynthesis C-methylase UbiE
MNAKKAIEEIFRVTKAGGKIIISQIIPFGQEDCDWLYQIHCKKQPLLKNFLLKEDIRNLLKNAGYADILSCDYRIEESINKWIDDPTLSRAKTDEIKNLFLNAPPEYKALHSTKIINGEIFDTMRWVVVKGEKA